MPYTIITVYTCVKNLKTRKSFFKGFSMLELVAVLSVFAILSAIAVGTYRTVFSEAEVSVVKNSLGASQAEARRILAKNALETNKLEFPNDISTKMDVPQLQFTDGNSTDSQTVSVSAPTSESLILAIKSNNDCWFTIEGIKGNKKWGVARNSYNCNASTIQQVGDSVTGTFKEPTIIFGSGPPAPPTQVQAVALDAEAEVSWEREVGDIQADSYKVTGSPGGATCETIETSCVVTGLLNGTTYTFTVIGINQSWRSVASSPSGPVTPYLN